MNVTNDFPHPRVLFEHVPQALFDELKKLVPYAKLVSDRAAVHEPEFDLVVTFTGDISRRSNHLHVLSFGADVGDNVWLSEGPHRHGGALIRRGLTRASLVVVNPNEPRELRELAQRTIAPEIPLGEKRTWKWEKSDPTKRDAVINDLDGQCTPIVTIGEEGFVAAFRRQRRGSSGLGGWSWVLPKETNDPAAWLTEFLSFLHNFDPDRFPGNPDWVESTDWSTHEVQVAADALDAHRRDWEVKVKEFERIDAALSDSLSQRRRESAAGAQRLLTADGDDLQAAAQSAFELFGFNAADMDGHHDEKTGAKLEDLRVTDPDRPGWMVLVEVKGYKRGAKANDVAQILARPVISYVKETGEEPDAVWHIVNANRESDPSGRPRALPAEADLAQLEQQNGLMIDTRELFRAVRKVEAGELTIDEVRTSLAAPPTRWVCP